MASTTMKMEMSYLGKGGITKANEGRSREMRDLDSGGLNSGGTNVMQISFRSDAENMLRGSIVLL